MLAEPIPWSRFLVSVNVTNTDSGTGAFFEGDVRCTLQRPNTENSKQILPEKELRGVSPNFHIHVSVSNSYIPSSGLPILLQENIWTDSRNIHKSLTDMNVEIRTDAAQFLFWEYINGVSLQYTVDTALPQY
jgi:hypothetical protein